MALLAGNAGGGAFFAPTTAPDLVRQLQTVSALVAPLSRLAHPNPQESAAALGLSDLENMGVSICPPRRMSRVAGAAGVSTERILSHIGEPTTPPP
jgi:hypothetical protein